MPYDAERDQFYWGYSPGHDGSGYDSTIPSPKLSDAYRVLKNHIGKAKHLQIVVTGKVGSSGQWKGIPSTIRWEALEATATGIGLRGKAVTKGGGGFSLEQKIQALLGLKMQPEIITGLYFRILD